MKPNILIVGPSGSGKSMSLRNLDPKTTVIADLERKGMPFKFAGEIWCPSSAEPVQFVNEFKTWMNKIATSTTIQVVVIDSITKLVEMLESKSVIEGKTKDGIPDTYAAYRLFAKYTLEFLELFKSNKYITICTGIDEHVTSMSITGETLIQRRLKISGRAWEGKVEKEFLCVFYTYAKIQPGKDPAFYITGVTDGKNSAKCPPYFNIPRELPNDAAELVKKLSQV